jgi:hypothetical protein
LTSAKAGRRWIAHPIGKANIGIELPQSISKASVRRDETCLQLQELLQVFY